jgi:hypothetical protein
MRLNLFYRYRCLRCHQQQLRGSSAKRCDRVPWPGTRACRGPLVRLPGNARPIPLQIAKGGT